MWPTSRGLPGWISAWCEISIRQDGHALMIEPAEWLFAIVGSARSPRQPPSLAPERIAVGYRRETSGASFTASAWCSYRVLTGVLAVSRRLVWISSGRSSM